VFKELLLGKGPVLFEKLLKEIGQLRVLGSEAFHPRHLLVFRKRQQLVEVGTYFLPALRTQHGHGTFNLQIFNPSDL
jgi:hypothetical protein